MPFMLIQRYAIGFVVGLFVTIALLYVMQAVIKSDKNPLNEAPDIRLVDFVRILEDESVIVKNLRPEKPPEPDVVPPDVPRPDFDPSQTQGLDIGDVSVEVSINIDGTGYSADGEYLPILKVLPIYPRRALSRGLEGYVLVEFCVTKMAAYVIRLWLRLTQQPYLIVLP